MTSEGETSDPTKIRNENMPVIFGEQLPRQQSSNVPVLPNVERRTRPRFTLKVHPNQWEWDVDQKIWCPRLSKMNHDPGVQGVGYDSLTKTIDTTAAESHFRKRGFVLIENGNLRLLDVLTNGEYVVRFRAGKGYAYCWAWEGFEKVGRKVYWEVNKPLKAKVQAHIAKNFLTPMHPRLKVQEIRTLSNRVRRLAESVSKNPSPSLSLRLKAAESLLRDWEKEAKPKPAPKPKGDA